MTNNELTATDKEGSRTAIACIRYWQAGAFADIRALVNMLDDGGNRMLPELRAFIHALLEVSTDTLACLDDGEAENVLSIAMKHLGGIDSAEEVAE